MSTESRIRITGTTWRGVQTDIQTGQIILVGVAETDPGIKVMLSTLLEIMLAGITLVIAQLVKGHVIVLLVIAHVIILLVIAHAIVQQSVIIPCVIFQTIRGTHVNHHAKLPTLEILVTEGIWKLHSSVTVVVALILIPSTRRIMLTSLRTRQGFQIQTLHSTTLYLTIAMTTASHHQPLICGLLLFKTIDHLSNP